MYDLVILGATFLGIGACYSNKGKIIILERSEQIGYEYINSYNYGTNWLETPLSIYGEKIRCELIARNILSMDGNITMPAFAPLMYNLAMQDNLPVWLGTEIIDIKQIDNYFEIKIFTVEGMKTLKTKKILDTTMGACIENKPNILEKRFNALIFAENSNYPLISTNKFSIRKGKNEYEYILSLVLNTNATWKEARKKLDEFWITRQKSLEDFLIIATATHFQITLDTKYKTIQKNHILMPSYGYKNSLEAFETGVNFTEDPK